jgi:hypothetical protein
VRRIAALVLVALAAAPGIVGAQRADVRTGDRVRFDAPTIAAHRVTGTIVRTAGDTMHIVDDRTRMPWVVDADRVTRLSVSLGQTPRTELVRQGLVVGATAGGVIGAAIGLGEDEENCRGSGTNRQCDRDGIFLVQTSAIGAVAGAVVGALVGLVRPSEQWMRVDAPVRVGAAQLRDGSWAVAVRLSVR